MRRLAESPDRPGNANGRVAFFTSFPPPATGQSNYSFFVRELVAGSHPVDSFDLSDGSLGNFSSSSKLAVVRRTLSIVKRTGELVRHLKRNPTDTLYVVPSSSRFGHLRDAYYLRRVRPHVRRIVAHVHSGNFHEVLAARPHFATRTLVDAVDRFIFLSHYLEGLSAELVPASKRVVIPNTIDAGVRFSDEEVQRKLAERAREPVLRAVFIGNFIESKGYQDFVEAVRLLHQRGAEDVEAVFAGNWPSKDSRDRFEAYVREHELGERVRLLGPQDRSGVRRTLAESDVLVLPTYYPTEAQPLSIIEALNAGTPIVSTRRASIPEYVSDNVNGLFVDERRPDQIASALERLCDRQRWLDMAHAARETFLETFAPAPVARALLEEF